MEWKLGFARAVESRNGETIIHCAVPDHPDWENRLIALNKEGREISASRISTMNEQTEWLFEGLPLESVREFQFQVRRRHWVEFRNIALAPSLP